MFGALKYTAKMLGLRKPRDAVDPQFTRPQGFHDPNDLDLNKLRRLIKRGKLAPCYPGRDAADDGETEARPLDADAAKGGDGTSSGDVHFSPFSTNAGKANATSEEPGIGKKDERAKPVRTRAASSPSSKPKRALAGGPRATDECPICFLCYPCLNKSRCCSSEICTECYLRVRAPSNAPEEYDRAGRRLLRPPKCPFCKTEGYGVAFGGAKSDADRAAEAEERAALAKALEAARAAELAEQTERRARRASVEARRASVEAPNDPSSASAAQTPGAMADGDGADGAVGEPLPESLPSSPVPVGWEEEYAAMTPTPTDPAVGVGVRHGGDRGAYRSASFIRSASSFGEHPRTRAPRESRASEEEARRRASRRDFPATTTTSSSSRRGARARAFLPAGTAFLPRNPRGPAEPLTGDPAQHRAGGIGLGSSRGGPASGGHEPHASREARSGDERRVLREIARRAESRRERRRLVAERDAPRGGDGGDGGEDGDEAFLARVRDFIPARLLEESFGDLGGEDVDGEEALDVAASRALDIDDVMMMEAVYLSLQEQEEANRRRADAPSGGRADLAQDASAGAAAAAAAAEAAEVEEAIALVAAAEAAEAAERAGRSAATTTTARVDASREATEDAEGAGATRSSSGELELERDEVSGRREAPEGVSVVHLSADSSVDEAGLTDDEAETETGETDAFDAVDESLAALEAEASRITARRVSPLSRRPATPPAAADADAEKSSPRAPPPDADDTAYPAVEIGAPALEAEPEAEAARASADAAGAPRAGEEKKNAPEENEPAPDPAARGSETLPSAPGAGAGAGAGTDAVAETAGDAHDANANVERALESVERASSAP